LAKPIAILELWGFKDQWLC